MKTKSLRCYDYATVPYEEVRALLETNALGLFQRATLTAAERAKLLGASLRAKLGPIDIGAEVQIRILRVTEEISALGERSMRLELTWTAAQNADLFPSMEATLIAYALSSGETQLELKGRYKPPFGPLGTAIDAVVGHRIAEAAVHRFVQDVAKRLNDEHAGRA